MQADIVHGCFGEGVYEPSAKCDNLDMCRCNFRYTFTSPAVGVNRTHMTAVGYYSLIENCKAHPSKVSGVSKTDIVVRGRRLILWQPVSSVTPWMNVFTNTR